MAMPSMVQASSHNVETTNITFTQSELDNNWVTDRKHPSGDVNSVSFDGRNNVARIGVLAAEQHSNSFYHYEGIKRVGDFGNSVQVDLYVPSDWEEAEPINVGLWSSDNPLSAYPLIVYRNNENIDAGFYTWDVVYDEDIEKWVGVYNLSAVNVNYDGWNTLSISLDEDSNTANYAINEEATGSIYASGDNIGEIFMNHYNDGVRDYDAYWHGMSFSRTIPTGDVEINAYFCEDGTSISWGSNGPDGITPDECVPAEGLNFSNVEETDKEPGDPSSPWSNEPIAQTVSTNANGVAVLEDLSAEHRHGIISEDYQNEMIFYACEDDSSSGGNPQDEYEYAFPVKNQTKQCVAYFVDSQVPAMSDITMFVNGTESELAKSGDEIRIEATVVDESGVNRVQIWVRNFPYTGEQLTSGEMTNVSGSLYEFVFTLPETYESGGDINEEFEGNYFNFRPTDSIGNNYIGSRENFTIDNTAPNITNVSLIPDLINPDRENPTLKANIEDIGSGVEKVQYKVYASDGSTAAGYKDIAHDPNTNSVDDEIDIAGLEDGEYSLGVRAFDNAGNKKNVGNAASSIQIPFTVDTSSPRITNASLSLDLINSNEDNPTLTADIDGTGSNVADVQYRIHKSPFEKIDGFGWEPVDAEDGDYDSILESISSEIDVAGLGDGEYLVRVRAFDEAGNKKSGVDVEFTVDNTAPVAEITQPNDEQIVFGEVELVGEVTDENSKNSHFEIQDSEGNRVDSDTLKNGSKNHEYTWDTSGLDDGFYTIYFEARDLAGNKDGSRNNPGKSVYVITVTVDNTAPDVDAGTDQNIINSLESQLSGTADDTTTSIASVLWTQLSGPGVTNFFGDEDTLDPSIEVDAFGTYTYELTATDETGNEVSDTVVVTFEEDDSEDDTINTNTGEPLTPGGGEVFFTALDTGATEDNEEDATEEDEGSDEGEDENGNGNGNENENGEEVLAEEDDRSFSLWWWLLPIAILFFAILFARRRKDDESGLMDN
ncbi:MAG: Ig-like domain-containing protein [Candidatus Saccharimonadales bacterium]